MTPEKSLLQGGYVLVERLPSGREFPVGSIIEIDGRVSYVRDIGDKHIFRKGDYEAIFTDEAVLQYLKEEGIEQLVFHHRKDGEILKTNLETYLGVGPRKMYGRKQRGIKTVLFDREEREEKFPRPKGKVIINLKKEDDKD